ncbi:uncharacterized protein LOC142635122 [Castanea sativa]|uniref:uncharacterized protein LOC142635122 n=1 Tax=Castanea sativa TaxID=21020 RepID=UPI003F651B14
MAEGTPVKEHCLRMIFHLNTLEVLGADIDGESQADIIHRSLPETFKEFRLNYNTNKKIYTLSELMNELVTAEGILDTSSADANVGFQETRKLNEEAKLKKPPCVEVVWVVSSHPNLYQNVFAPLIKLEVVRVEC